MTCEQFDAKVEAYLAGTLSDADSVAMEMHASECARCELTLDAATRISATIPAVVLPVELRKSVLEAVGASRNKRRIAGWSSSIAAIAAAVIVTTMVSRGRDSSINPANVKGVSSSTTPRVAVAATESLSNALRNSTAVAPKPMASTGSSNSTPQTAHTTPKVIASVPRTVVSSSPIPQPTTAPDRVAYDHSATEFTALDTATRELEAAIAKSPHDTELRTFLETVRARRDELVRRVKAASS